MYKTLVILFYIYILLYILINIYSFTYTIKKSSSNTNQEERILDNKKYYYYISIFIAIWIALYIIICIIIWIISFTNACIIIFNTICKAALIELPGINHLGEQHYKYSDPFLLIYWLPLLEWIILVMALELVFLEYNIYYHIFFIPLPFINK